MMSTISANKHDENGAEMEPNSVYMMATPVRVARSRR